MTHKGQVRQSKTNQITKGWGKIVHEYSSEGGKRVRVYENGCSIIGEPNLAAQKEVASNLLRFLIENPSILDTEFTSRENVIQIYFHD